MRIAFLILIGIHGLIHLVGHFMAYNPGKIEGMSLPVPKGFGFLWLLAAIINVSAVLLFAFNIEFWWIVGVLALPLSQFLIIRFWQDARYGTIGNVLLLFGLVIGYYNWDFKQDYFADVNEGLERIQSVEEHLVTKEELAGLPLQVQRYLKFVGVVGKPAVINAKVKLGGEMRTDQKGWYKLRSEQFDFFDDFERLFFISAKRNGIGIRGYHRYIEGNATMLIKLLSAFPIVEESGKEMLRAETVTLLNDMCLLAPATLLSDNIRWQEINDTSVEAILTVNDITISATLVFNEKGKLVNFLSDDRYDVNRKEYVMFSTPVGEYANIGGFNLPTYVETIWHYPEGDFVYGKFKVRNVQYNVDKLPFLSYWSTTPGEDD